MQPDVNYNEYRRPVSFIVPISIISLGAVAMHENWLDKKNDAQDALSPRNGQRTRIDDNIQFIPLTAELLLGWGKRAKHNMRERLALTTTSTAVLFICAQIPKKVSDERRPDGSGYNSWPSGHTATAFMGADLVRRDYGWLYGGLAYSVAATVAYLRVYNNRHWLNDVLSGAGIGIFSVQCAYMLLPLERRLFRWDKKKNDSMCLVVPSVNPHSNEYGIQLTFQF